MSKYADKQFWIDVADRAVSTFAQGILGSFLAGTTSLIDVDITQALGVGGFAALVSVLTTIAFRGGATAE